MKISLNWLSDFIKITEKDAEKIKQVITANTAEVETMENRGGDLKNVVVGQVEEVKKHPNADTLKLCTVNDGKEKLQVVCGGSNLKKGMKVAFGQIGAVVRWHGSEVMKLEKVKIRGEESFGMICASEEIGLKEMFPKKSEKEIMDISHLNVKVGTPLAKALELDDTVLDVDNHALTNRGDLFSHLGFAREFVANGLAKWKKRPTFKMPANNNPWPIEIELHPGSVKRYMGVYMTGIQVNESPEWMKKRLTAVGIRPISNIVDVTNYVMMELGIPNHTFDLNQIPGKKWTMRKGRKGEKLVTLDKTVELNEGVTTFDDGHALFDLCGIIGGENSGINQKTSKIWLHVVAYDKKVIRHGARSTGQITDSSIIYEKGIDPELPAKGLERCVELILQVCPTAKVASKVMDVKNYKKEKRVLQLTHSHLEQLVGEKIPAKDTKRILNDLGFETRKTKDGFAVTIPSWRLEDVKLEADLIEEVARIYGYDNIPIELPQTYIKPPVQSPHRALNRQIKTELAQLAFDEIYTYSFLGPELLAKCGQKQDEKTIEIANPISADISLMRQSLLPRTLETIANNLRYQDSFRLFELSKVYAKKVKSASGGGKGHEENEALIVATVNENFRELQGVMEHVGLKTVPGECKTTDSCHPGRVADLTWHGQNVGKLYEVHPRILKNFDIKPRVTVAEVDLQKIHDMKMEHRPKYQELPKFPPVVLDISIAIPKRELAEKYSKTIGKTDKTLITDVDLIDEYKGDKIDNKERALTYRVTYQAADRTLKEGEVNAIHQQVLKNLKNAGAAIR
ncbi:MAG: phenylalanine--tRNA ligase subunit beta [Candidatus Peregrinibacteria bacterium]